MSENNKSFFTRLTEAIRLFSYKHLSFLTKRSSGLLSICKNKISFYRGGRSIQVNQVNNRLVYDNYEDWQKVQTQKGKKEAMPQLWQSTREKQCQAWDFAEIKPGEKMLEVGFRDGLNLKHLKEQGLTITGIEVNQDAVDFALSLSCQAIQADIQKKTAFAAQSFAIISAIDVLEHCFDAKGALTEMCRILQDSGRIVVCIPFEENFGTNVIEGHSSLFPNKEEFARIARSAGLQIDKEQLLNRGRNLFLLKKATDGCRK